jgi:hypothetical protein
MVNSAHVGPLEGLNSQFNPHPFSQNPSRPVYMFRPGPPSPTSFTAPTSPNRHHHHSTSSATQTTRSFDQIHYSPPRSSLPQFRRPKSLCSSFALLLRPPRSPSHRCCSQNNRASKAQLPQLLRPLINHAQAPANHHLTSTQTKPSHHSAAQTSPFSIKSAATPSPVLSGYPCPALQSSISVRSSSSRTASFA